MIQYADPPILLRDVIEDLDAAKRLLERNAPYTPLGGWYRPDADLDAATSPMWFQNDFVHADLRVEGSELFLGHERVIEATRRFYDAEVVVPHSLYVNWMAAIERGGPAHTDNPRFCVRDRSNTPMWLLRVMLWSGLFDRWAIVQATSIWWMNDVEGGEFLYWPEGPDEPPQRHFGEMANTALVGDNHGMFHQVGPVGPFDRGTLLVTPRAELAPVADGSGDWAVIDRGEVRYRAPLETYRVSVLWKADVYRDEQERRRLAAETLSIPDVARVFDRDLSERGADFRFDLDRIEDPGLIGALSAVYPEAVPVGAVPSIFDAA
ncbi:MAG: hypothetical protein IIA30_11400 [Myxococcales bacterium]|nr:hypothetical protein [Myxococcales bacterium]